MGLSSGMKPAEAYSTMAGISSAASGVASIGGAFAQSQASAARAHYQQTQYEMNAKLAEFQAEDALKQGEKAVKQVKQQVKSTIGSQRAALAAQGVDVGSGSALEVQEDTAALGALDALTIKNNAARAAWGYKVQAQSLSGQGAFAGLAGRMEARNTLLTGGLNAIGAGTRSAYYFSGGGGYGKEG